jgi:hypothetical protein
MQKFESVANTIEVVGKSSYSKKPQTQVVRY